MFILLLLGFVIPALTSPPPNPFTPGQHYDCIYERIGVFNCSDIEFENVAELADPPGSEAFWGDLGVVCTLLLFAGFSSGMAMSLSSYPRLKLQVLARSGSETEKTYVHGIQPLVSRHHLVLVTLLLVFVGCIVSLPIFLTRLIGDGWIAIVVGIPLALFFGEIIPQALFFGGGLAFVYYSAWFVWGLIIVFGIVAWPISVVLDAAIGRESLTDHLFRRGDLKELVQFHAQEVPPTSDDETGHAALYEEEVGLISGVLELREKTVSECMTKLEDTYMLSCHQLLTLEKLKQISKEGHSRVPIYHGKHDVIVGMLLTSDLIGVTPNDNFKVQDLEIEPIPRVISSTPIYKMLEQFRSGNAQMAVILDAADYLTPIGIITFDDVIEVLLQSQLSDERDLRLQQSTIIPIPMDNPDRYILTWSPK